VLRFERAGMALRRDGRADLAKVAVGCGYYDQAHLTNEWRGTGRLLAGHLDRRGAPILTRPGRLRRRRLRIMSEQPQPTVWPALRYDDAPGAVRFLVDVFGFREAPVVPGDGGDVVHAESRWPEGGGVMLGSTKFTEGTHAEMKPGVNAVYVVTDDVDGVYARGRPVPRSRTSCRTPITARTPSPPAIRRAINGLSAPTVARPEGRLLHA
jgi:hypothetical protein